MSSFVDKLTKSGLEISGGNAAILGIPSQSRQVFFDSPQERAKSFAEMTRTSVQPSIAEVSGNIPETGAGNVLGPDNRSVTYTDQPTVNLPKFIKPSFREATTDEYGMEKQNTPGVTKLGKLFQILGASAKGAMAGRAASERAVAESGGRRTAGFATGFEAGRTQPLIEANQRQALQTQQLQNEERANRVAMLPWQIAATKARAQAEQARTNYWNTRAGQKDQQDLEHLYAKAVQDGDQSAADRYAKAIQSTQRPAAERQPTEFSVWREQNPGVPIEKFWEGHEKAKAKYDKGRQPNQIETWTAAFRKKYGRDPEPEEIASWKRDAVGEGLTLAEQRRLTSDTRRQNDQITDLRKQRAEMVAGGDKEGAANVNAELDKLYAEIDAARERILSGRPQPTTPSAKNKSNKNSDPLGIR